LSVDHVPYYSSYKVLYGMFIKLNTRIKGVFAIGISNIVISAFYYVIYGRNNYGTLYLSHTFGIIVFSIAASYLLFDKIYSKLAKHSIYIKALVTLLSLEILSIIMSSVTVNYIYFAFIEGISNHDAIGGSIIYLTWTILFLILGIPIIIIYLILGLFVFIALEKRSSGVRPEWR